MFINNLDTLLEEILNKFNVYLEEKNLIKKIQKEPNFVKFQPEINKTIFNFYDKNSKMIDSKLKKIIKESDKKMLNDIIIRYLAYYIFLSIGYYYKGGRDLFITNIIEISKNQTDSSRTIPNFYDSENNSIIINYFSDIKNLLGLLEFKTIDRVKIVINNAPIKYENITTIMKLLGEDYFESFFLIKNNYHNIIKTIIFRLIYLNMDRENIIDILGKKEKDNAEYKFIEIVVSKSNKIADFTIIQNFLAKEEVNPKMAKDLYQYLEDYVAKEEIYLENKEEILDYIFTDNIFIPISQDFLKFHRDNEKYEFETKEFKERDATKIKYIVQKFFKVQSLHDKSLTEKPLEKKKIMDLFYKQLSSKDAVLYNDTEDLKIIQKLLLSEKTDDLDLLIDLENIRRYAYLNYKTIKGDGFKIRPSQTIRAIRQSNFKKDNLTKNINIETRGTNSSMDCNMVGIVFNPSGIDLNCFNTKNLVDVRTKFDNSNGYASFSKMLNENFNKKKFDKTKLYYWLFDISKDNIELSSYQNLSKKKDKLKIMIEESFMNYYKNIVYKIYNIVKSRKNISAWLIKNFIEKINRQVVDLELNKEIFMNLIFDLYKKIPNIKTPIRDTRISEDRIIRLPIINKKLDTVYIKKINISEVDDNIDLDKDDNAICHHYIKWEDIKKIPRKMSDKKNQAVYDFVKKYVRENQRGDFICKSCGEYLKLSKYVFEGTYVKELDMFLTTSLAVQQNLEEIPKYIQLNKTIKNSMKNLERIANVLNITSLLGTLPDIRLRRKLIIKNVLDSIILHSDFIKMIGEKEKKIISTRYNNNLSNLIFFKLEDSIFVTRSDDTDKLKLLKFNNIISYLILFILTDINHGMIIQIKEDKKLNYFFFNRFKDALYGDIKIRVDQKTNIKVKDIPLLAYTLYMLSGTAVNNSMWMDINYDSKKAPIYQKILIYTVIDIFNTMLEAYFSASEKIKSLEGNYLYEILSQKFMSKLNNVFNDKSILKKIEERSKTMIRKKNNKISFVTKKINNIMIEPFNNNIDDLIIDSTKSEVTSYKYTSEKCQDTLKLDTTNFKYNIQNYDEFSNCPDGKLHNWKYVNDNLICKKCQVDFNVLYKKYNNTTTEKDDSKIFENIRLNYLRKLAKNFCLDGNIHELDNRGKCTKCKITPSNYKYSTNDLNKLEISINKTKIEDSLEHIKNIKKQSNEYDKNKIRIKKILLKFSKRYYINSKLNLRNYVNDFINNLEKKSGGNIKYNKYSYYLKLNKFIINNDYLGKQLPKSITILNDKEYNIFKKNLQESICKYYHPKAKKIVYIYFNKGNQTYYFYDCNSLIFIGSSENSKDIKYATYKSYLTIIPSIKEKILSLGLNNSFINLIEYQHNLIDMNKEDIILEASKGKLIKNIISRRVSNLKQIINKTNEIIEKINNCNKSKFNTEQDIIVNEFRKLLKNIDLTDEDGSNSVFKHKNYILNNIINLTYPKINQDSIYFNPNPIMDLKFLEDGNLLDNKLIFFLIFNFNRLISYNSKSQKIPLINYLIVRLIDYNYKQYNYYIQQTEIKRFISYIYTDQPYIDDNLRVIGVYNELVDDTVDIDEETKNALLDNIEAEGSLDIDDYESDDPETDSYMEALDNSA